MSANKRDDEIFQASGQRKNLKQNNEDIFQGVYLHLFLDLLSFLLLCFLGPFWVRRVEQSPGS